MADNSRKKTIKELENLKGEMESLSTTLAGSQKNRRRLTVDSEIELESQGEDHASRNSTDLKLRILQLKIQRVEKIIEEIRHLPGGEKLPTPNHLTRTAFHTWIQSNEEIYELQSKIMEIQATGQKQEERRRVARAGTITPSPRAMDALYSFFKVDETTLEFRDHLRSFLGARSAGESVQQQSFIIKQKSFLDALFSVNEGNQNFEGRKLREYVKECWSDVRSRGEWGAHPRRYHAFTQALSSFVVESQEMYHERQLEEETVQLKVESNLIPAIRKKCLEYVRQRREDDLLSSQCKKYRNVTQSQMGIGEKCQSAEPIPYLDAISKLKATYFCVTPTQKMSGVIQAARSIFSRLAQSHDDAVGADDFMDIWCYVVIKADLPELATTCNFLAEYSRFSLTQGEGGYFLSSLQGAAQYILSLTDDNLIPLKQTSYVFCCPDETRAFTSASLSTRGVISECCQLEGYKAYVNLQWIFNQSRPVSVLLVKTGNLEDKICAIRAILQDEKSTESHLISQTLNKFSNKLGIKLCETIAGLAVGFETHEDVPEDFPLAPLSQDNPKAAYDCIQVCMTLNHLSIPFPEPFSERPRIYEITEETRNKMNELFQKNCLLISTEGVAGSPLELIKESQVLLQHLGYLTILVKIDGVYSDILAAAVRSFQVSWNKKNVSRVLRTDGRLCPDTRLSIQEEFAGVWEKMKKLGLIYSSNPFSRCQSNVETFRHFVAECQKSWGLVIHSAGVIGPKTIKEIDRQLTALNPLHS
eukprot:m.163293 g.163293  ORF g.163293 m.163293 type:complete len:758 (+) comp38851_c0_seq5:107-2380(+)